MTKETQGDLIDVPQLGQTKHEIKVRREDVEPDPIIRLAMNPDVDPDKLQKVIDMFNAQKDRQAKEEFDRHFVAMQSEFEPVARSKQGDKAKYAPLEALQKQYDPIIHKHGFSYRWSEQPLPDDGLRVILTISGYGHSETNSKDLPKYEPDKGRESGRSIMNNLQAEGTRSSYGKRYTFHSGFGLTVEDEDTDGSFDDGVRYGEYVKLLQDAQDVDTLKAQRKFAYDQLGDDRKGKAIVSAAARKRYEELTK